LFRRLDFETARDDGAGANHEAAHRFDRVIESCSASRMAQHLKAKMTENRRAFYPTEV
jgi:hypothetical protein